MEKDPRLAAEEMLARLGRLRRFSTIAIEALPRLSDDRAILERDIEVLSEASRHLPQIFKSRHPEVDWRGLADVGNVIRHGYDIVSGGRLGTILEAHLDPLERALDAFLKDTDRT